MSVPAPETFGQSEAQEERVYSLAVASGLVLGCPAQSFLMIPWRQISQNKKDRTANAFIPSPPESPLCIAPSLFYEVEVKQASLSIEGDRSESVYPFF